jgi:hypothetical protein
MSNMIDRDAIPRNLPPALESSSDRHCRFLIAAFMNVDTHLYANVYSKKIEV